METWAADRLSMGFDMSLETHQAGTGVTATGWTTDFVMVWRVKPFCRMTFSFCAYAVNYLLASQSGEIRASIGFRPLNPYPRFVA